MKKYILATLLLPLLAFAGLTVDPIPPLNTVSTNQTNGSQKTQVVDGSGNVITSSAIAGGHQAMDVNAVGVSTSTVGDLSATGSITTTCSTPDASCPSGSYVLLPINGVASAQLQVDGSFSGASLNADGSVDNVNWVTLLTATGSAGQYTTNSFSSAGKYRLFRIAGFKYLRARASALSSGSVSIVMNASIGTNIVEDISVNPANLLTTPYLNDGAGNPISSQVSGSQRALDMGIDVSGVQVDPRTRTWTLSNSTDSCSAYEGGTWNLNNISGTVSLPTGAATSANQTSVQSSPGSSASTAITVQGSSSGVAIPVAQSGTWTVQQGSPPWSNNITQFGGTNISTGTGVSGAGIPRVTVSNDSNVLATQSGTWTVNAPTGSVSGSVSSTGNVISVNGLGIYGGLNIAVTGTFSATYQFQGSNDGTNYFPVQAVNVSSPATAPATTSTTTGLYYVPITFTWFKLVVTAYSSGTISAVMTEANTSPDSYALGMASAANQTAVQGSVSGGTAAANALLTGGVYNSSLVTPSSGQQAALQLNAFGMLAVTGRFKYSHIAGASTTTVKSGSGVLHSLCYGSGGGGYSITAYDNTAGSGTVISVIDNTAAGASCQQLDVEFSTGLTIVTVNAGNEVTVAYY